MLAPEIVRQIRDLAGLEWGAKANRGRDGVKRHRELTPLRH